MSLPRSIKILPILALAVFAAAAPLAAQERRETSALRIYGEPSPAQAAAVDAVLQDYWRAWGAQDADRLAALHASDTEWINAFARMFQDSASLHTFLKDRLFTSVDAAVSAQEAQNARLISLRYLGHDVAIAHYYTDSPRGASRNESETLRRTHMHFVLERHGDDWRIVHTAIFDAR